MKTLLALILFSLTACGLDAPSTECPYPGQDFRTDLRSCVYLQGHTNWTTASEASTFQTELLTDLSWGPKAEECLGHISYEVEDFPIRIPGRAVAGYQDGPVLHVADMGSARWSAFKHETIHWLQHCVYGVTDYNHERPEWRFQ